MAGRRQSYQSPAERLTEQFYEWERRGRGWAVHSDRVDLEPPFIPFFRHFIEGQGHDANAGRQHTFLSALVQKAARLLAGRSRQPSTRSRGARTPKRDPQSADSTDAFVEFQACLPPTYSAPRDAFEQFLVNAGECCRHPLAFEVLGAPEAIEVQLAASVSDAESVARQLEAHLSDVLFSRREGALDSCWRALQAKESVVVEFGLSEEFMTPLRMRGGADPLVGITAALAGLEKGEAGVFQILLQPARRPWPESIIRAVMDGAGGPFFRNAPDLVGNAKAKVSRPLYCAGEENAHLLGSLLVAKFHQLAMGRQGMREADRPPSICTPTSATII